MGRAFEYRRASKEKRWANMSRIFPRISRAITMAVKSGGSDPEMNPKLRLLINQAKKENMPKDNIDSAIKRATEKDAAEMKEINYEGKGPHGALIFVETATDNGTRTVANIKSLFKKAGGEVLQNGAFDYMFTRKSVFQFKKPENIDLEELELELIDAGLESIEQGEENDVFVYGTFSDFGTLQEAFEKLEIDLDKANTQHIPNTTTTFTEDQLVDIEKLIDQLEDDEDVQLVSTNIE
jgi:YebC/PmpR family DNA-binding regulatory protein